MDKHLHHKWNLFGASAEAEVLTNLHLFMVPAEGWYNRAERSWALAVGAFHIQGRDTGATQLASFVCLQLSLNDISLTMRRTTLVTPKHTPVTSTSQRKESLENGLGSFAAY